MGRAGVDGRRGEVAAMMSSFSCSVEWLQGRSGSFLSGVLDAQASLLYHFHAALARAVQNRTWARLHGTRGKERVSSLKQLKAQTGVSKRTANAAVGWTIISTARLISMRLSTRPHEMQSSREWLVGSFLA